MASVHVLNVAISTKKDRYLNYRVTAIQYYEILGIVIFVAKKRLFLKNNIITFIVLLDQCTILTQLILY